MSNNGKLFTDQWSFASEIKTKLGAASYDIARWNGKFSTGRDQWMCSFFDKDHKTLSRHIGMQLVSARTGKPYEVFSREAWREPREPREPSTELDSSSAFDA